MCTHHIWEPVRNKSQELIFQENSSASHTPRSQVNQQSLGLNLNSEPHLCWGIRAAVGTAPPAGRFRSAAGAARTAGPMHGWGCTLLRSTLENQVQVNVKRSSKCPRESPKYNSQALMFTSGHLDVRSLTSVKCLNVTSMRGDPPSPAQLQSQYYHKPLSHRAISHLPG